jgi:hypothetical protein
VDGTLVEACASQKSFQKAGRDDQGDRFRSQKRTNQPLIRLSGAQDTYCVGTSNSVDRIYQQTFVDPHKKVALPS